MAPRRAATLAASGGRCGRVLGQQIPDEAREIGGRGGGQGGEVGGPLEVGPEDLGVGAPEGGRAREALVEQGAQGVEVGAGVTGTLPDLRGGVGEREQ